MADHLRPTAPIAADAILPADPGLALALAQELIGKPVMANHHHGLWGYHGAAGAGELTIQATGIGGPSAAAVLAELARHGVRRAIGVGRCRALGPGLEPGEAVIVAAALSADGASRALGIADPKPDAELAAALASSCAGAAAVRVASADLYHDPDGDARRASWRDAGAAVTDLQSAAVLALGARLGLAVAAVLVVEGETGADEAAVEKGLLRAGAGAAEALDRTRERRLQTGSSPTESLP